MVTYAVHLASEMRATREITQVTPQAPSVSLDNASVSFQFPTSCKPEFILLPSTCIVHVSNLTLCRLFSVSFCQISEHGVLSYYCRRKNKNTQVWGCEPGAAANATFADLLYVATGGGVTLVLNWTGRGQTTMASSIAPPSTMATCHPIFSLPMERRYASTEMSH